MDKTIDIGIITVIPSEIEAIFEVFNVDKSKIIYSDSNYNYWSTEIYSPLLDKNLKIVISHLNGEAGNTEAAICTTHFLRDWHPRLMCLIGITAGIRGKVKIGDVVIPNKIHNRTIKAFKGGKYFTRGTTYNRHDIIDQMIKISPVDAGKFSVEYSPYLFEQLKIAKIVAKSKELTDSEFSTELLLEDGSISSDNTLIRDPEYFKGIIEETDEKCRGGEMEAAGFVRSCEIENIALPWMVFRGISDFGDNSKGDEFQKIAAKSACIAAKLYFSKIINVESLPLNIRAKVDENKLQYNIIEIINDSYDSERWQEVCDIGALLSRHLWLTGQYQLRIEIGKKIEQAAFNIDLKSLRARTLIDDLGWTSYIIGENQNAKKHITDGLMISKEIKDFYMLAKGNRHLAAINRQNSKYDVAKFHLKEANKYAKNIVNEKDKETLSASLLLSEGKLNNELGKIDESLKLFNKALEVYKNIKDIGREVKVYSLIAKIQLKLNQKEEAYKMAYHGRKLAFDLGRFDEISTNSKLIIENFDSIKKSEKISIALEVLEFSKSKGLIYGIKEWTQIVNSLK
ncbi:MAG: hypothetical protein Q8O72_05795 [Bacteroidales bacterium]|nr:hypothetical protein [Bacteroidales bacterium]